MRNRALTDEVGLVWSSVAYLFCAAAPDYGWLLFCRFLQGIGASLIVSCAPALVTGLFPEERRSRAVSAVVQTSRSAEPKVGPAANQEQSPTTAAKKETQAPDVSVASKLLEAKRQREQAKTGKKE